MVFVYIQDYYIRVPTRNRNIDTRLKLENEDKSEVQSGFEKKNGKGKHTESSRNPNNQSFSLGKLTQVHFVGGRILHQNIEIRDLISYFDECTGSSGEGADGLGVGDGLGELAEGLMGEAGGHFVDG